MPKTIILYRSPHHGNTKKLLDALQKAFPDVVLAKAGEDAFDVSQFDVVGIASGIYMGKLHTKVRKTLKGIDGSGRKAFVIYTCGDNAGDKYSERAMALLREQGFQPCGFYWCPGFDTVGPLRFFGGVNKGRPSEEEINGATAFYRQSVIQANNDAR